jgi:UDP-3-O-[3-hydroxymyristoyl] glucosamine N-acyltransferase
MYKVKDFEFSASDISGIVDAPLIGDDIIINKVNKLECITEHSMIICYETDRTILETLKTKCLVFCNNQTVCNNKNLSFIVSHDFELLFFRFINEYLISHNDYWLKETISTISANFPEVRFGYNVKVGKNVIIAPGTSIGSNSIIGSNVIIRSNVEIGDNCLIKDNTVIGSEGFGFISSNEGYVHIPQIGGIKIGNDVVMGSNCTIEKPVLGFTLIGNNVKIDDLVQIGQNQEIGDNTIIATGYKAEAGVKIGKDSFIGMSVTIISGNITVGNNCIIGAGTILTKSIHDNKVVHGISQLVITEADDKLNSLMAKYRKIR